MPTVDEAKKNACIHFNSFVSVSAHLSLACPSTLRVLSPSLPYPSLPLFLSLSVVVLPCDRREGSPGGALLGGDGVLLWQALLHLLLPDQDTQVDVLWWRSRQRGETGFSFFKKIYCYSFPTAAWVGCTVQQLVHPWALSVRGRVTGTVKVLHDQGFWVRINYVVSFSLPNLSDSGPRVFRTEDANRRPWLVYQSHFTLMIILDDWASDEARRCD